MTISCQICDNSMTIATDFPLPEARKNPVGHSNQRGSSNLWRRGRDCSPRPWGSPLAALGAALRTSKIAPGDFVEPRRGFSPSLSRKHEKTPSVTRTNEAPQTFGGEGGIRTLDGLLTHTPLAGERLQPLGHLSGKSAGIGVIPLPGRFRHRRIPQRTAFPSGRPPLPSRA